MIVVEEENLDQTLLKHLASVTSQCRGPDAGDSYSPPLSRSPA